MIPEFPKFKKLELGDRGHVGFVHVAVGVGTVEALGGGLHAADVPAGEAVLPRREGDEVAVAVSERVGGRQEVARCGLREDRLDRVRGHHTIMDGGRLRPR